ncbi:patched domain-containing protein 3 [Brachyhypopomus gauderio]|uniref:patched domain-containing protein 3 n=1 Tax=Brachyhypopomus gauderio TaxID=698409 RepID=UPI0040427CA0
MVCTTDCIEKPIRFCLERVGKFIGLHPWWFVSIPLFLSAALGGGFCLLEDRICNDILQQFTPVDGRGKTEKRFFETFFPHNEEMFSSQRLNSDGIYAALIFTCRTNILSVAALDEVLRIDHNVRRMSAQHGAQQFLYDDICARVNNSCYSNLLLHILDYNATNIKMVNLTFPVHHHPQLGRTPLDHFVGKVEVDNRDVIQSAKAVRLFYYLQERNGTLENVWLTEFVRLMSNSSTTFTQVSYFTSISRQQEFEKSTKSVTYLFALTYFIAIIFSVLSCIRLDCVRNKVWVASLGVISTGLAVLSSFGFLLLLNVPFVITVASSPFLILGIGIDDMFIMISCWQQTNVQDSVADRMARTYREAAILLTVTTLTDVLAFYLSFNNPFPSVQSFCLYAGTAILFCYLYNITFFGACLALNGRREKGNRHWLTCMKVLEECPPGAHRGFAACCVGGAYNHETRAEEEHPMTVFFRKYYGPVLTTAWSKASVIVLYIGYISISVYGCTRIKEGIDLKNLAVDRSYLIKYYEDQASCFSDYGPNVMLAVNGTVRYWEEAERAQLESCFADFISLPFVNDLSTSWLHSFERYAEEKSIAIGSEATFKEHLHPFLRQHPMLRQDVSITNGSIRASRVFLQTVSVVHKEKTMLQSVRNAAQHCDFPLVVYHPAFIYYDQYTVIADNTIQTVSVATLVMLVISLSLIPNPLCALWVAFAIASVVVGVAGFMALLGINLDSISMINLVICIGFSVDFSAHISHTFASSTKAGGDEKVVEALSHLGYPILQGALSTMLGVVALSASVSYIFRTFFTIMFLVISFGLIHGIAFIPVFLSLSGFFCR